MEEPLNRYKYKVVNSGVLCGISVICQNNLLNRGQNTSNNFGKPSW